MIADDKVEFIVSLNDTLLQFCATKSIATTIKSQCNTFNYTVNCFSVVFGLFPTNKKYYLQMLTLKKFFQYKFSMVIWYECNTYANRLNYIAV